MDLYQVSDQGFKSLTNKKYIQTYLQVKQQVVEAFLWYAVMKSNCNRREVFITKWRDMACFMQLEPENDVLLH